MIKRLHLRRFKSYTDAPFELGRVTVLTGANGTGKSTIIQALLLARQAAVAVQKKFVDLNYPKFNLALGEAMDVLNFASERKDGIEIELVAFSGHTSKLSLTVPDERSQRRGCPRSR